MTAGAVIDHADVLIVGAGHAGAQCAIALRQKGFEGSIALIGRESELPYERPPLSKDYFAREKPFERLHIRPLSFWRDRNINLVLGREVIAVDAPGHRVVLSDGPEIGYGHLVWAAGGDPRKLACPGADLAGVHGIRTRADCDRLMAGIDAGWRRFVVIGGGYIGLEAAAVLRKAGCEVTLLEAGQRVLARVAGPEISAFYEAEHRAMGVDLRTDVTVSRLWGEQQVTGVELADGKVIPADAVIVGIGIQPCIDPLAAAGVLIDGGVRVDEQCRTSLADIHAIGDCVSFACAFADDAVMRVESVQNANDQASCVASALCGQPIPYRAFPWFWSNQYDLKLQTAGLSVGHDAAITRGDPATRAFSVVYMREGRVIALDCVNMVKDYVQGRKLIEEGARLDPAQVGDVTVSLKDLMLSARMRA